jgi:hypothetical protein
MTDATSAPDARTTRTPTAVWIVMAVLAAVVVFTSTLALFLWRRADELRHDVHLRQAAERTAAEFATALYTYDFNDLASARARVLALATPQYAKDSDAISKAQQDAITRLKAKEQGKVTSLFLGEPVKDRVGAVVVMDSTLDSTAGKRNTVSRLDVVLQRQGSTWKVATARPES